MTKNVIFNKNLKFVIILVIFIDASNMFDLHIITYKCRHYNTMIMN